MEDEERSDDQSVENAALASELEQARAEAEIHRQNSVLFRRLAMYEMAEIEGMARDAPGG